MAEKEYIERTAAQEEIKKICNEYNYAYGDSYGGFAEKIANVTNNVPTADVQEVRHASWVKNQEDMYWGNYFIRRNCSICGGSPIYREGLGTYKLTPYCPHCGAKMSEKVGEDNGNYQRKDFVK